MPELRFSTPLFAHEFALDPEISLSLCNNSGGAEAPTYGRFSGERQNARSRAMYGSLARLAGADLKYIQKARGHSSITVTAEIYAHLFDSELDQVSDALDSLTEGVGDPVYVQNTSTGPDPGSDRAP